MYYTYVVRPDGAPEGKGPQFQPFWDGLMNWALRGGFLLKAVGLLILVISGITGGQVFHLFGILSGRPSAIEHISIVLAFVGTLLCTIGAVAVQNFRSIADDDASIRHSRGFRAGIKGLHQASLLDILSWGLTSIILYSQLKYFDDTWANELSGSSSSALLACCARTLHALALILYGSSLFLLESFHDEGTAEFWAWVMGSLFHISGISEILALIYDTKPFASLVFDTTFTITLFIGVVIALFWSTAFEPVVQHDDVKLTQSAMRCEFYKSKNAMSYYGLQQPHP